MDGPEAARELARERTPSFAYACVEMRLDGAHGDEQRLRDLLVRAALGRQLDDAPLGRRQLAARRRPPRADAGELRARLARPSRASRARRTRPPPRSSASRARAPLPVPPLRPRPSASRRAGGVAAQAEPLVGGRRPRERRRRLVVAEPRAHGARSARAVASPHGCSWCSARSRRRSVTASASSSSPSSASASTRSGATGNAPGSSMPSRSVWSQTARRCSAARAGSCGEQRGDARARGATRAPASRSRAPRRLRAPASPSAAPRRPARARRRAARGSAGRWA